MSPCCGCGKPYDDSFADWSICRDCKFEQMQMIEPETVYMDGLGICWAEKQLKEAGGKSEVDKLVAEARYNK